MRLYGLQKVISDLPPIPPYSLFNIDNLQQRGNVNLPNYTIVLQWDYRIQLNDWAYFQAFVQYFIQPNGMVQVRNATILGFTCAVAFQSRRATTTD